jgi:Membrane dipeptidase (Peptidase family M19)
MKHCLMLLCCLILMHSGIHAQTALDTLRYVDFHIHTTMKNYYRDIPQASCMWDNAFLQSKGIDTLNWDGDHRKGNYKNTNSFSGFYGKTSYPQASYDLLQGSKASILCTSITPQEKKMVSRKEKITVLGIPIISLRKVNNLGVTKLSLKRMEEIYNTNSYEEYQGEYTFQRLQKEFKHPDDQRIVLVKDRNDLFAARNANKIALVLTLEGGHILFGNNNSKYYLDADCKDENMACLKELTDNIAAIKAQDHHPFFMTLSHLAWNRISGQAKGLATNGKGAKWLLSRLANSERFRKVIFTKHASGLVDTTYKYPKKTPSCVCTAQPQPNPNNMQLGRQIVTALLDTSNNRSPILIDMRHMDIQAREEYMQMVSTLKQQGRNIPLIVSHAAASGKNRHQASVLGSCPISDHYLEITNPQKYYRQYAACLGGDPPCIEKTSWFFPWSINLYDEEIAAVYQSDGIIGITLEERVLGTKAKNYSKKHFRHLHNFYTQHGFNKAYFAVIDKLEPLMRNILYIVEHSGDGIKGSIETWEHIALGSDFDGIVDPIDVCTSAKDIPQLYSYLCKYLPTYASYLNKQQLLLDYYNTPEVLLNKLFYQNGEKFIFKYYDRVI